MRYNVVVPVVGHTTVIVEAQDAAEAVDLAIEFWDDSEDEVELRAVPRLSADLVDVWRAEAEPADGEESSDDD